MSEYAEAEYNVGGGSRIDIAEGQEVMPFYLILDQSGSMYKDLGTLRQAVEQIIAELRADPETDDTALLSVISFGDSARVTIPLSRLSDITSVPELTSLGGTRFSAGWEAYDRAVKTDTAAIKAKKGTYHRPCVFFLTDGEPNDNDKDFRQTFLKLQGKEVNRAWPYVIAYGFRDAKADVLKEIAYPNFGEKLGQYFLLKDNDAKTVIEQVKNLINQTVIRATAASAAGSPDLQAAQPAPGQNIDQGTTDSVDEKF